MLVSKMPMSLSPLLSLRRLLSVPGMIVVLVRIVAFTDVPGMHHTPSIPEVSSIFRTLSTESIVVLSA